MINNFKDIIQTVTNDITAMNGGDNSESKRSLKARQECLNVEEIEECLEDLEEIIQDPSEILGGAKRSIKVRLNDMLDFQKDIANIMDQVVGKKRQEPPSYSATEQEAVCNSFRSVCYFCQNSDPAVDDTNSEISSLRFTNNF